MAIKNLREKLNRITSLPRISRAEISSILKDCYNEGVESWKKHERYLQQKSLVIKKKTVV